MLVDHHQHITHANGVVRWFLKNLLETYAQPANNTMHSGVVRVRENATRKTAVENQKSQSNEPKQSSDDKK
jgi:hypothetical protein